MAAARYRGSDQSGILGAIHEENNHQRQNGDENINDSNNTWFTSMLYTCRIYPAYRRRRGRLMLCVILLLLTVLYILYGLTSRFGGYQQNLKNYGTVDSGRDIVYGIVFDAGSTGSRIHIFRFLRHLHPESGKGNFELLSDDFFHTKPGLSDFANRPSEASSSLEPLMKKARLLIPENKWSSTMTILHGTAGLRLIPQSQSTSILNNVEKYLSDSGLLLPINKYPAISIMDGSTEGIMSWATLNYVLNRLPYPSSTYGALDLGGGSTQITYLPVNTETLAGAPKGFVIPYVVTDKVLNFYTYSYLGLGLMSARYQMMGGIEGKTIKSNIKLSSPCLPPEYKGFWYYGGQNYSVHSSGLNGYQACMDSAELLVTESYHVDSQREFQNRPFYAFSYFYDRAEDVGLVKKGSSGRSITVNEFLKAADDECSTNTAKRPFLCMDLCYISSLLLHGYRFSRTTSISVAKKANDVELSWCLGTMVHLLYANEYLQKKEHSLTL